MVCKQGNQLWGPSPGGTPEPRAYWLEEASTSLLQGDVGWGICFLSLCFVPEGPDILCLQFLGPSFLIWVLFHRGCMWGCSHIYYRRYRDSGQSLPGGCPDVERVYPYIL